MQPPDHQSLQPSSLRLERHQIADARFVESSAVVDHQHVARCSPLERLQEKIDTADMLSRSHPPSQATAWHHRAQSRRRAAYRDLSAKAGIRQMGSSQRRQPPTKLVVIHGGAQGLILRLRLVARSLRQRSEALPGRGEDIEGDTALLAGDGSVGNVRWNNIDIAWMEDALFASKLKLEGSFKDGADLFLPMLVDGSHGVGLEVDEVDIQAVPENRSYDNAGFNGQRRGVPLEVQVRRPELRIKLVLICWTEVRRFRRHRLTS